MGFNSRFFITLLAVCIAKGAWAQCCSCDTNDGCPIGKHNLGQNPNTGYVLCEPCGGLLPGGGVNCDHCNCYGYDDLRPFGGNPDGKKCKKVAGECPSPCEYYKLCDVATGNITATQIVGACHMENNTCYSNTRACNMFANRTENYDISCAQSSQQGQAEWNGNAWNVGNCGCDITNVEIGTGPFGIPWWCDSFNADFHVSSANQNVSSASGKIVYTLSRMYCAKCHPGYLPKIENAQVDGVYSRPDNNGNWGVVMCNEQVSAPDYAPGCVIDFNLSMDNMMAECRKTCPDGFATEAPGATRVEECQYDEHTTYTDDTGTFYIRSLDECL